MKSPVLWIMAEITGFVVNKRNGMMAYWNVGVLGLAELDLIF